MEKVAQRLSRASIAAVLLLALGAIAAAASETKILARYDFEDENTPSGPDTHFIVRWPQGNVQITPAVRVSGSYSLEIREVADDGNVSEFQGYIPVQKRGHVYMRFAFLLATPLEEFNIALAGPEHFTLGKDGIAIWLAGRDGNLLHYSDSIWRKLFVLASFTWYFVEIDYNVDAGVYDLVIRQERRNEPVISLQAQPNAASAPGSAVSKYSFISTPPGRDTSNVTYYIDDLIIWTGEKNEIPPFVAPGRRKFFVDRFAPYREAAGEQERAGDAEFAAKNPAGAKQNYEKALETADANAAWYLRLKLADVAFLLGDLEMERRLREAVYGSWRK